MYFLQKKYTISDHIRVYKIVRAKYFFCPYKNIHSDFKKQQKKMVVVTLQRDKCIGCNYCVEVAPEQFQMSKKDGKSVLLRSTEKKGFFTLKSHDDNILEPCQAAQKACPEKITTTKQI